MTWYLQSPQDEQEELARFEDIQRRMDVYRETLTEDTARRVASMHQNWPHLSPGIALALAQSGLEPDSPEAIEVAQVQADSGFWGTIGDALSWLPRIGKGIVRTGLATLEGAWQEASSFAGSIAEAAEDVFTGGDPEGRGFLEDVTSNYTDRAAGSFFRTGFSDLGSGFLPGGQAYETISERARNFTFNSGQAVTPGRAVAELLPDAWVEPGTKPYQALSGLVDFAAQVVTDPSSIALKAVGRARRASQVFQTGQGVAEVGLGAARRIGRYEDVQRAGGIVAPRYTVLPEVAVNDWLTSTRQGRGAVQWLAKQSDPDAIRKATRLPSVVALDVAEATTDRDVVRILSGVLGTQSPYKPKRPGRMFGITERSWGPTPERRLNGIRILQQMPGSHLSVDKIDDAVNTLDAWQKNAKLPAEIISKNNRALMELDRLDHYDATDVWKVLHKVSEDIDAELALRGVDTHATRDLFDVFDTWVKDARQYAVDELGMAMDVPGAKKLVTLGGRTATLPSAHLLSEFMDRAIPLPDSRVLRRETSWWHRASATRLVGKGITGTSEVLADLMDQVWKPLVLLRGAWTVRVVGEEQVRMAAAGLTSAFRHPLEWIAWASSSDQKTLRRMARNETLTGDDITQVARDLGALGRRGESQLRPGMVTSKRWGVVSKGHQEFLGSWERELSQLWNDPVARKVAGGNLDEAKEWFLRGDGRVHRESLTRGIRELADDGEASRYIDTVWARIQVKTGGKYDPDWNLISPGRQDLIDSIATGNLRGINLQGMDLKVWRVENGKKVLKDDAHRLRQILKGMVDDAPDKIKVEEFVRLHGRQARAAKVDGVVDTLFNALMTVPSNTLSRSKAFAQFYWRRAEELVGHADAATQLKLIAAAEAANLPDVAKRMRSVHARGAGTTLTDLAEVDTLAKGYGVAETKRLLYDTSKRSQFADTLRLIYPFAEAWKEILTTWSRLFADRPQLARRFHQGVEAARYNDNDPTTGIFYKDPGSDDEMFAMPGGGLLGNALFGKDVALRFGGKVAGLNLFSQGLLPGFGPIVQTAASVFVPDKPSWDGVREFFNPYGEKELPESPGGVLDSWLPGWMKRLLTGLNAPDADRTFDNTVKDAMGALWMSGQYENTPEGLAKLESDARSKTRWLYLVRGLVQWGAPTAPSVLFALDRTDTTETGQMFAFRALSSEYNDKVHTEGFTDAEATAWMIGKYGIDPWLITRPKSRTLANRPVTDEGSLFLRNNPQIAEALPLTAGYFAPEGDAFDITAYNRQFDEGVRQHLTPQQWLSLANQARGAMQYDHARELSDRIPSQAREPYLRAVREQLAQEYPGYGATVLGVAQGARVDEKIEELAAGVATVQNTEAGRALAEYLRAREMALARAEAMGLTSLGSQSARPLAAWLTAVATQLIGRYPTFGPLFAQVLRNELPDLQEQVAA